jgi:hypothetical protein
MKFAIGILCLGIGLLPAQQLTKGERERAMSELHASRKQVLDAVAGLSQRQLDWKASPEKWSLAEVVEHLAVTEDFLMEQFRQTAAKPAVSGAKSGLTDEQVLAGMTDRSTPRQAPQPLVPKRTFPTTTAALEAFKERRDRNIACVETTTETGLRQKIFTQFNMDAYQLFLTMAAHSARHVAQMQEVRATAGFPKR